VKFAVRLIIMPLYTPPLYPNPPPPLYPNAPPPPQTLGEVVGVVFFDFWKMTFLENSECFVMIFNDFDKYLIIGEGGGIIN
jgi:hypothetical protein